MKILVGLGNPGKEYKNTRHNAGWLVVDKIAEQWGLDWRLDKKLATLKAQKSAENTEILLVKPQTFMNKSGIAVRKLIQWSNETIEQLSNSLFIIHDDLDLKLGEIKIVKDRGPAGHKGVQSVIDHLKTQDFVRFRVGINKIKSEKLKVKSCEDYVLGKFKGEEKKKFEKVIEKCAGAVIFGLENGIKEMMNEYN